MRLAIPHHQGRISPVFDAAGSVLLIDLENGREQGRETRSLNQIDLLPRAAEFLKLDADALICGAISAPLETLLSSSGVQVIGFRCGPVDEVVSAFLDGSIASPKFSMPGCRVRRLRFGQEGRNEMRRGLGFGRGGRGRGFGAGGHGRMGGPSAAGPGGACVCPKCGEKKPHEVAQPCNQTVCPKCGATMTRQ